jgi:hypothetical protein
MEILKLPEQSRTRCGAYAWSGLLPFSLQVAEGVQSVECHHRYREGRAGETSFEGSDAGLGRLCARSTLSSDTTGSMYARSNLVVPVLLSLYFFYYQTIVALKYRGHLTAKVSTQYHEAANVQDPLPLYFLYHLVRGWNQ